MLVCGCTVRQLVPVSHVSVLVYSQTARLVSHVNVLVHSQTARLVSCRLSPVSHVSVLVHSQTARLVSHVSVLVHAVCQMGYSKWFTFFFVVLRNRLNCRGGKQPSPHHPTTPHTPYQSPLPYPHVWGPCQ